MQGKPPVSIAIKEINHYPTSSSSLSSLIMAGTSRQSRGRQKIEMKLIENHDDRLVTFSKRRSGIFKKVSELITMCGALVGVVVFSPTGKPLSFWHPSIQSIVNRFLNRNVDPATVDRFQPMFDDDRRRRMDEENNYINDLLTRLDEEKKKGKALKRITRAVREGAPANMQQGWWEERVDELSPQDLEQQMAYMKMIHNNICNHLNRPVDLVTLGLEDPMPAASNNVTIQTEASVGRLGENIEH